MFKNWIFLLTANSAFALTTLTVQVSTDNDPGGDGEAGDLRYCLNLMNENLNNMGPDDYAIIFDFPMTIQLNGNLPIINNSPNPQSITIGNPGPIPTVTIDGNDGAYSGFFIPTGNVTIQNMIFQNLCARGGNGGDGNAGGGGGMGAGGAIYTPTTFLYGSNPSVTLINVSIQSCSAIGGNGGSYLSGSPTGDEGSGGGGGFSGNGGSITSTAYGICGGGGGGGYGGDGGNVVLSTSDAFGGGGGGGGGIGSRATVGTPLNLGNGGADNDNGQQGNGYGLSIIGGSGGGNYIGGNQAGGGGGGSASSGSDIPGGGGGGSLGISGLNPEGSIPPAGASTPSGGYGGDGGGGGGGGVVAYNSSNGISGKAGSGGYGGGGGGGAGSGAFDTAYTVEGGLGGVGGGGGGGGPDSSGFTPGNGGNSSGGGGGGGGGPSYLSSASGGIDTGNLGGGSGGMGASTFGVGSAGGGGGGGGSGLGGAIFVDTDLNFNIQALSGIPTFFNTSNNTVIGGSGGTGGPGDATDGFPGSALGDSIFLRTGASLTFIAQEVEDILTLGDGVSFVDDTSFGGTGTSVFVIGNGTVIYNGSSDYQGSITINNANFQVNGVINEASVFVCRNLGFSSQRGTLSGSGTLTGTVFVNSGTIFPETGGTLSLGSLSLSSADPLSNMLGSLVHIEIDSSGTSLVSVTGAASLAGILEIDLDPNAVAGTYTILTSSGITGTFDSVEFTGTAPSSYSVSYLPIGAPTFVQFTFSDAPPPPPSILEPPSNLQGKQKKNDFGLGYELYNQLTWNPSPSSETIGYFIYRDGKKIATVDASTYIYKDHNRKKSVSYTYAITAFKSADSESSPVNIVITP